jgi:hypothetical protein
VSRDLSVLCPPPEGKEQARSYQAMQDIVRKVVVNAAIHRPKSDIMLEVYLAGLWHGVKMSEPEPRKPDYLEIAPPRRGRTRKASA